jgi:hypothetical protein
MGEDEPTQPYHRRPARIGTSAQSRVLPEVQNRDGEELVSAVG